MEDDFIWSLLQRAKGLASSKAMKMTDYRLDKEVENVFRYAVSENEIYIHLKPLSVPTSNSVRCIHHKINQTCYEINAISNIINYRIWTDY